MVRGIGGFGGFRLISVVIPEMNGIRSNDIKKKTNYSALVVEPSAKDEWSLLRSPAVSLLDWETREKRGLTHVVMYSGCRASADLPQQEAQGVQAHDHRAALVGDDAGGQRHGPECRRHHHHDDDPERYPEVLADDGAR